MAWIVARLSRSYPGNILFQWFKEQFVGQAKGGGQFVDLFGR
jgi:hypothetical protein